MLCQEVRRNTGTRESVGSRGAGAVDEAGGGGVGGEVDAGPDVFVLTVFDTQAVEDVCSVEASVIAQLPRDDLEGFGEGFNDGLLLEGDVPVRELVQMRRHLHLAGTTPSDDAPVLDGPFYNHDGVVQAALNFGDELFGASTQDKGTGFGGGAGGEDVEAFRTDLDFFKEAAGPEVGGLNIGAGGLDGGACGGTDAVEVGRGNAASAEDVAVGKVSCGYVVSQRWMCAGVEYLLCS